MDSQNNATTKIDVYQIVTDQIISLLEKGIVPWQKPWTEVGLPANLLSKRQYRGINLWLLLSLNYEQNLFLTWDQIKGMGASVKKDEKGHIVVFWKPVQKRAEENTEQEKTALPILRYYKVFNIAQCRDIPSQLLPLASKENDHFKPLEECEKIIKGMPNPPVIVHKEQMAYYRIDTDTINMPKKKSFKDPESYYSTLYHELVHSTGSDKRLGRRTLTDMVQFGAESYAMEELIAEMGSAFLCHHSGIKPFVIANTAAYLDNWLKVLRGDKRFIISASGQAQRAVDMVLKKEVLEHE